MNDIKQNLEKIAADAKGIDTTKASSEILNWVANNVVYFIDNKTKMFKLDLIIDDSKAEEFPETKKLQDLYRAIPEETTMDAIDMSKVQRDDWTTWEKGLSKADNDLLELYGNCRTELDKTTALIYDAMCQDSEGKAKVYEKMSYFYELKGINKGNFLLQELEGAVGVMRFEYESYSVPVTITKKRNIQQADGSVRQEEDGVSTYTIPDGFSIWLEISFRAPSASLF